MPRLQVIRGKDGKLRINDGVTGSTRRNETMSGAFGPGGNHSRVAKTGRYKTSEGEGHAAMKNQRRLELLALVAELSERYPDWRLGQLIANVSGWADQDVWEVEDEPLLEAMRLHLEQVASSVTRSA